MNFGKNLQALRKARKISQEDLAGDLNVSRQAVGKWESGTVFPDIERLAQISDYFGVSMDSLVKGNPEGTDAVEREAESALTTNAKGCSAGGRNRRIRYVAAFALILISPFFPGEPGAGTVNSFLMLLCVISGAALLIYNYLSGKGMDGTDGAGK